MKKAFAFIVLFVSLCFYRAGAQVVLWDGDLIHSGMIGKSGKGCWYTHFSNSNPEIGMPASGEFDGTAYFAINKGDKPINAEYDHLPGPSGFAYVSNSLSNSLSVINVITNQPAVDIEVGVKPAGIATTFDGKKLFVVNSGSNSVSVINTSTNRVESTIPIGHYAVSVCVDRAGTRLYIPNYQDNSISVINVAGGNIIATISNVVHPYDMCITADGNKLYVSNNDPGNNASSTVTVVNTQTNSIVTQIPVGVRPESITIGLRGNVYVANSGSNSVTVINTIDNTVIETIPVGNNPHGIALSPSNSMLYTFEESTHQLLATELATKNTTRVTISGSGSRGIGVSADGQSVFIPNTASNDVSVINTRTNKEIALVPTQQAPTAGGNFVIAGQECFVAPWKLLIYPAPRVNVRYVLGQIITCSGKASSSKLEMSIEGLYLKDNLTVTAPAGFEISTFYDKDFGPSLNLLASKYMVMPKTLFIRTTSSAPAGPLTGDVVFTSKDMVNKQAISATVNQSATVNSVPSQSLKSGETTAAVSFAGIADDYSWTNNMPGIGLPASGTGNIAAFVATNNTNRAVVAKITVTPLTTLTCGSIPTSFNITVQPDVNALPPPSAALVPNTFTPNGDGVNDTWDMPKLNITGSVRVYNRYGALVFTSKAYPQPWDGKSKNKNIPAGTYYYVIIVNDKEKPISGYVTIIR